MIRGVREKKFAREARRVTLMLLNDSDDMVQKGLGWLLREQAKYDPETALPVLRKIRARAPRLVLRTACETLPIELKREILSNSESGKSKMRLAGDEPTLMGKLLLPEGLIYKFPS